MKRTPRAGLAWSKALSAAAALLCCLPAHGQTLAHRNWQGSGLKPQAWWARAVFCRLDLTDMKIKGTTRSLEQLAAIGCDAVETGPWDAGDSAAPVTPVYGSINEADQLIEEVSRRKMRLVLEMRLDGPVSFASEQMLAGRMRFWLTRGVAGFVLEDGKAPLPIGMLRRLRLVTASALGTRVLIGDGPIVDGSAGTVQLSTKRVDFGVLTGEATERAASLRVRLAALNGLNTAPLLASVEHPDEPADANRLRLEAATLLLQGTAAMIRAGASGEANAEPSRPQRKFSADELLLWRPEGEASIGDGPGGAADVSEWVRMLNELHHGNPTLQTGQATFLDQDAQGALVWVVRGKGSAVLVACNLSSERVNLRVGGFMRGLQVRGSFLKTLLRSDGSAGAQGTLERLELGPGAVFIGEIR